MAQVKEVKKEAQEPVIYTLNVTATRIKNEKYDFLSFSTINKKGKIGRVKFTMDCPNIPQEEGMYRITVNKKYINQDKSMKYLTYWVSKVEDYYSLSRKDNTEDLPFDVDSDDLDF